ncbi:AAA family ATPase [Ohtaekwangia kribbensis]|jgi:hypothetical protein|uniref:DNA 3'-5' helicase II n=1 Tax=Ohtaekwangia kribbensis TaxID=688913 RepID=A0ABW3K8N2_9BACT
MNFTPEQQTIFRFVQQGNGIGIIDAVAGAGKTTTIMECARHIPMSTANVLFCAFNKSIAKEIAGKLAERGLSNVTVKTIHAFLIACSYTFNLRICKQDLQRRVDNLLISFSLCLRNLLSSKPDK